MKDEFDVLLNFYEDSKEVLTRKWEAYGLGCHLLLRHYSASIDNEEYLKAHGLLSLTSLLRDKESPISQHLLSHGVLINLDEKTISFGDSVKKIRRGCALYGKLFGSTNQNSVELFYFDVPSEGYSCVSYCPEILDTIQEFIQGPFSFSKELMRDWGAKATRHVYETIVPANCILDSFNKPYPDFFADYLENRFPTSGRIPQNGDCTACVKDGVICYGDLREVTQELFHSRKRRETHGL